MILESPAIRLFLALLLLVFAAPAVRSQHTPLPKPDTGQSTQEPAPLNPGFTLQTGIRIVLTDVTVRDAAGHIVHNLPASAFHVAEDNKPQTLRSFTEVDSAPTAINAEPVVAPGVWSNEYLRHLPPVLNIIVLDAATLSLPDQMYLGIQFRKFLATLPSDKPIALYGRRGVNAVLLQTFTTDHQLLQAAADKVLPHLRLLGDPPASDASLLGQIALDLGQIPGKKNVIWFNGGSPLIDAGMLKPGENQQQLQQMYDLLEAARVSLYPVDARGLVVSFGNSANTMILQQQQMRASAESTGGEAIFNNNGLALAARNILAEDNSFYTLTFAPENFTPDNKFHKIKVTVDHPGSSSGYQLSYRQGYFADGMNMDKNKPDRDRVKLLSGGQKQDVAADIHSSPIIFQASVIPAAQDAADTGTTFVAIEDKSPPAKHGEHNYVIRYTVPGDTFNTRSVDGREHATVNIAALAFNSAGQRVGISADHIDVKFPSDNPHLPLNVTQHINVRPGDDYFYLAIWDTTTGRLGALQIPVTIR